MSLSTSSQTTYRLSVSHPDFRNSISQALAFYASICAGNFSVVADLVESGVIALKHPEPAQIQEARGWLDLANSALFSPQFVDESATYAVLPPNAERLAEITRRVQAHLQAGTDFEFCSAEEALLVSEALELYARIGIGQIESVIEHFRMQPLPPADSGLGLSHWMERFDAAQQMAFRAKHLLFGYEPGQSAGIYNRSVSPAALAAWHLRKSLEHRLAFDRNPAGGVFNNYDGPMQVRRGDAGTVITVQSSTAEGQTASSEFRV